MKARLKFSKIGSIRFIGHLDVMRYFQKAFRRADISISYSQGYSPHQLMSFASPLGIGLSSDAEYLDIVLEDSEPTEHILERINAVMNDEIAVKAFTILEEEAKTSMAVLAACDYLITVKPDKQSFLQDEMKRKKALETFLKRDSIEILKKTKRSEKMVDIKNENSLAKIKKWTIRNLLTHTTGDESQMMSEVSKLSVRYEPLSAGFIYAAYRRKCGKY